MDWILLKRIILEVCLDQNKIALSSSFNLDFLFASAGYATVIVSKLLSNHTSIAAYTQLDQFLRNNNLIKEVFATETATNGQSWVEEWDYWNSTGLFLKDMIEM